MVVSKKRLLKFVVEFCKRKVMWSGLFPIATGPFTLILREALRHPEIAFQLKGVRLRHRGSLGGLGLPLILVLALFPDRCSFGILTGDKLRDFQIQSRLIVKKKVGDGSIRPISGLPEY